MALKLVESFGLSDRRVAKLVDLSRTALRYRGKNNESEKKIVERMNELVLNHKRWGSPMFHMILKREGLVVNHKRTERIYYKEAKLSLKVHKRKKRASVQRLEFNEPQRPNQRWSMDFVHDRLWGGRALKSLALIDLFTKESLNIHVDFSINGLRVARILGDICEERGYPESISVDNGPEFISQALDKWAYKDKVHLDFIEPGKPIQNAHIESFNGRYRDECLNLHYFTDLQEAREIINSWRHDYNTFRPHSSINGLTPEEFATKWHTEHKQKQQPNTDKFNLQVV